MAQVNVSALTPADPLTGTEEAPLVQGGATKRATTAATKDYVAGEIAEFVASSPYCTDSGAADAYVLTVDYAPANPSAYNDGDQYRFRATATNTGASTVNVNGLGVKTLVTVTGVALPAGYIRTDVDTKITYDAANDRFVADREAERGSNANGEYRREADGTMTAEARVQIDYVGTFAVRGTWTFPAGFAAIPFCSGAMDYASSSVTPGTGSLASILLEVTAFTSTSAVQFSQYRIPGSTDFASGDFAIVDSTAKGVWY